MAELPKRRQRRRRAVLPGEEAGGVHGQDGGRAAAAEGAGADVQVPQRLDQELANKGLRGELIDDSPQ